MQPLWDFLANNKDALIIALAIVTSLSTVLWSAWKFFFERWWKKRLRVYVKVFEVITDHALLLPKLYTTENDDGALTDHRIAYPPRDPDRPGYLPHIQSAIDAASPGDNIIVRDATYFENPTLKKPLTLTAESFGL